MMTTEITAMAQKMIIENVYAPLPLGLHLLFCAFATLLYLILFFRRKHKRYFYTMLAIDLTLLTQLGDNSFSILVIAVAEVVLLMMILVDYIKTTVEEKRIAEAAEAQQAIAEAEAAEQEGAEAVEDTADETAETDGTPEE